MKFKVGDRVKIVRENSGRWTKFIGRETTITGNYKDGYNLKGIDADSCYWMDDELELISKEGIIMGKFYRAKQATPAWLEGAILEKDEDGQYQAINDLWDAFEKDYPSDYVETAAIVENNPDFFERVYEIKLLGKAKYLTKEAARDAHNKIYKEK